MNWSVNVAILLMTTNTFSGGGDKIVVGIRMRTAAVCLAQLKKYGLVRDFALPDCFEPKKALPAPPLRRALTRTGSMDVKKAQRSNNNASKESEDAWQYYARLELEPPAFRKKGL